MGYPLLLTPLYIGTGQDRSGGLKKGVIQNDPKKSLFDHFLSSPGQDPIYKVRGFRANRTYYMARNDPKRGPKMTQKGVIFDPFLTGTWPGPWAIWGTFGHEGQKRGVPKSGQKGSGTPDPPKKWSGKFQE